MIDSSGWIVIDRAFVALNGTVSLSVAVMMKLNVPTVEGVPLIVPLAESVKPAGRAPAVTDHETGLPIVGVDVRV